MKEKAISLLSGMMFTAVFLIPLFLYMWGYGCQL